jgi:hypothetical protein
MKYQPFIIGPGSGPDEFLIWTKKATNFVNETSFKVWFQLA